MRRTALAVMVAAILTPLPARAVPAAQAAPAAAPPRVCRLVVDPANDPSSITDQRPLGPALEHDPDLDILSGDVAADRTTLTAVVRPRSLRAADPDAPTGTVYVAAFRLDGLPFALRATYPIDGPGYYELFANGDPPVPTGGQVSERVYLATVTGVRDLARREIRIHAPLRMFLGTKPVWRKSRVTALELATSLYLGPGRAGDVLDTVVHVGEYEAVRVDSARASRDYVLGTPSCVAVGR